MLVKGLEDGKRYWMESQENAFLILPNTGICLVYDVSTSQQTSMEMICHSHMDEINKVNSATRS